MTISQAAKFLEDAFDALNKEYFESTLSKSIITIQSSPKTCGHFVTQEVWKDTRRKKSYYEINISAEGLNRPISNITATLVYEMVHYYCTVNDIQDISRGSTCHNKRFKEESEKRSLLIDYDAKIGYSIDQQATSKGVPIKLGKRYDYANYVAKRIKAGDSPDMIVNTLKREGKWTVSTTILYRYIEQGYIPGITSKDLLEKPSRKPSPKNKEKKKAARAPKGTSIERRPPEIAAREKFRDWEMDTVTGKAKGKKQVFLVLTERKTRYEIIVKLWDKSCKSVVRALESILSKYPKEAFHSITVDNGPEFQDYEHMENDKKGNKRLTIYYCPLYQSTERASNERANRIIRRFAPKGQSLAKYTSKDCQKMADWMNNYPCKILDYFTPAELFQSEIEKILE